MEPKTDRAAEVMRRAFIDSDGLSQKDIHEIVFHLTDWIEDLKPFVDLLENPDKHPDEEVRRIVIGLLAHAPDHLKIAADKVLEAGA